MNPQQMVHTVMTPESWSRVHHFRPDTNIDHWGDPYLMDETLVFTLDALRAFIGRPVIVLCGYEIRTDKPGSWHNGGFAADIHSPGMDCIDLFLAAGRFDAFNGIGLYPYWNNPGIHVDTRPGFLRFRADARWACDYQGRYVAIDAGFLNHQCPTNRIHWDVNHPELPA